MNENPVRAARLGDAPAVTELVRRAYQHYVARIGRLPGPMAADYHQLIAEGDVWVIDGVGGVGAVLVLRQAADHLLIENIAVSPVLQGSGQGGQLLRFAEQSAGERGLSELRLYTNEHMTENLTYYPRRGYVETGRRTQDGFTRVFFSKQLSDEPGAAKPAET